MLATIWDVGEKQTCEHKAMRTKDFDANHRKRVSGLVRYTQAAKKKNQGRKKKSSFASEGSNTFFFDCVLHAFASLSLALSLSFDAKEEKGKDDG
jgi:hypothetical protein